MDIKRWSIIQEFYQTAQVAENRSAFGFGGIALMYKYIEALSIMRWPLWLYLRLFDPKMMPIFNLWYDVKRWKAIIQTQED